MNRLRTFVDSGFFRRPHEGELANDFAGDLVMAKRERRLVVGLGFTRQFTRQEATCHAQESVARTDVSLFLPQLMLFASRVTAELPKPGFGIDRCVLPMAIVTKRIHPGETRATGHDAARKGF